MKLGKWMKLTGTTRESLADRIGVDPVTVFRYLNGTRRPQWDVLERIMRETHGDVTANDFLDQTPEDDPGRPSRQASACAA